MNENLRLVFLNGTYASSDFRKLYSATYDHWKAMWKATFLELDGAPEITSDNFTRQDEVMALFHQEKCIAIVCNRFIDLSLKSHFDDTYFSTWPIGILEKLNKPGHNVAIGNQISIDPEYRKLSNGVAMKDALMWLYHRRQFENVDLTLGAVREDKNLDKLFVSFGAEIVTPHVLQHGVPVALIAIWKDKIRLDNHQLPNEWLHNIYNNKLEDSQYLPKTNKGRIYEFPQKINRAA